MTARHNDPDACRFCMNKKSGGSLMNGNCGIGTFQDTVCMEPKSLLYKTIVEPNVKGRMKKGATGYCGAFLPGSRFEKEVKD